MIANDIVNETQRRMKEAVDGYAEAFDPCEFCKNQKRNTKARLHKCRTCCYYYPSMFEPQITKKESCNTEAAL